jgi:hypothetical protein
MSTGIIDYHLKCCMVEQKCKINITGRSPQKEKLRTWLNHLHSREIQKKPPYSDELWDF